MMCVCATNNTRITALFVERLKIEKGRSRQIESNENDTERRKVPKTNFLWRNFRSAHRQKEGEDGSESESEKESTFFSLNLCLHMLYRMLQKSKEQPIE